MKAIFICFLLALQAINIQAQDQPRVPKAKVPKKQKPMYELVDDVVKINLTSLAFRALALQYEHKISRSKTIAFGVIYRPNFNTPFVKLFLNDTAFTFSVEDRAMLNSSRYNSLMLTPELRFYLRKKAPRGIYLAPYLRYNLSRNSADYIYQESTGMNITKQGKYFAVGHEMNLGLMFGLQVLTRKKVTIDFWFLGISGGMRFMKSYSDINTSTMNEYDKAYVESITENYHGTFGTGKAYQWNSKGFSSKNSHFDWGARFFGINVGYAF